MSLLTIENQPIRFLKDGSNYDDLPGRGQFDFNIPVNKATDEAHVQFKVTPIAGSPEIIGDRSFALGTWFAYGSTSINTNSVTIGNGSSGELVSRDLSTRLSSGNLYQLKLNIKEIFGELKVYDGSTLIDTISSAGVNIITFPSTSNNIRLKITDSTSYVDLFEISMWAIPNEYAFAVINIEGQISGFYRRSEYPDMYTFVKDRLIFRLKWSTLVNSGCVILATADPEENSCSQFGIFNNDFSLGNNVDTGLPSIMGWTGSDPLNVLFKPNDFRAEIVSPPGAINNISSTSYNICPDKTYELIITASTAQPDPVDVYINIAGDIHIINVSGSTPSDYTIFSPSIISSGNIIIELNNTSGLTRIDVNIHNVLLKMDVTYFDLNYKTPHPFNLGSFDNDKFKLLGIYNNDNGLGFVWNGANFFPQIRVPAKFINSKYSSTRIAEANDIGFSSIKFGERRKSRYLRIEHQPTYIHDFLSLCVISDYFFVNNTQYFVDTEEYEALYSEELDNFGTAEIEVSAPTQLVRNINTGIRSLPTVSGGGLGDPIDVDVRLVEPLTLTTLKSI